MTLTADDLVKHLAALSRRFAGLAAKLAQAARELETGGVLPPESLIEELAAARDEFIDLRSSGLDAAPTLAATEPAQPPVDGVTRLFGRTLTVAATRGKLVAGPADLPRAPERPAPRPTAVDEPVRPVIAAATPSIAPRPQAPAPPPVPPARPPAPPVPPPAPPAPPLAPPAPPPAPPAPLAAPPAPSPLPPARPPASSPAAPLAPPAPPPAPPPPPPVKQEVAAAAAAPEDDSAPQVVETAALDEGAQWWVSAWARWTSWKGTIDFKAGAKQELGKYAYLLSVPIQQSADYEEGLLAYGYSILLDFLERQSPGIVTKALNSLKTFVPGKAAPSVGAHLYNFLVNEARLAEQYPEFVKSVLLAAVPEPGLWTQARILESATETSIFTHPSPRVGDPDHTTQRLTNDRQRFADHRFPVTLPPLTVRFFAVAADFREPREMDVKLKEGRAESNDAWLLTMTPVGRADLKSEVIRLVPEGSSVPALGRDCATLWVAVFNPDPKAEKKYDLTLTLKKDASR